VTFPAQIGAQGVQDIGEQTVVKKKPEQVVAVLPGCLKPSFNFVLRCCESPDFLLNPSNVFGTANTSAGGLICV
jgi:hypothetical protein